MKEPDPEYRKRESMNQDSRNQDEPTEDREQENLSRPLDLTLRRAARELEEELDGLFGISAHDIEQAVRRLDEGKNPGLRESRERLPPSVDKTLMMLEIVLEEGREAAARGDEISVIYMSELLQNYAGRLNRLLSRS